MRERPEARELSASVLRLTHALYRVTELLPGDEPLRRGIREKAGEIFSDGVAMAYGKMQEEGTDDAEIAIEILLGYLSMARLLGCANPMNFLVLEREYRMLAETLAAMSAEDMIKEGSGEPKMNGEANPVGDNPDFGRDAVPLSAGRISNRVNERQKKIMDRLAEAGQAKISDFYEHFNGISSKTIQRDLQDLTTRNIIKKQGEKRWTMYMLV